MVLKLVIFAFSISMILGRPVKDDDDVMAKHTQSESSSSSSSSVVSTGPGQVQSHQSASVMVSSNIDGNITQSAFHASSGGIGNNQSSLIIASSSVNGQKPQTVFITSNPIIAFDNRLKSEVTPEVDIVQSDFSASNINVFPGADSAFSVGNLEQGQILFDDEDNRTKPLIVNATESTESTVSSTNSVSVAQTASSSIKTPIKEEVSSGQADSSISVTNENKSTTESENVTSIVTVPGIVIDQIIGDDDVTITFIKPSDSIKNNISMEEVQRPVANRVDDIIEETTAFNTSSINSTFSTLDQSSDFNTNVSSNLTEEKKPTLAVDVSNILTENTTESGYENIANTVNTTEFGGTYAASNNSVNADPATGEAVSTLNSVSEAKPVVTVSVANPLTGEVSKTKSEGSAIMNNKEKLEQFGNMFNASSSSISSSLKNKLEPTTIVTASNISTEEVNVGNTFISNSSTNKPEPAVILTEEKTEGDFTVSELAEITTPLSEIHNNTESRKCSTERITQCDHAAILNKNNNLSGEAVSISNTDKVEKPDTILYTTSSNGTTTGKYLIEGTIESKFGGPSNVDNYPTVFTVLSEPTEYKEETIQIRPFSVNTSQSMSFPSSSVNVDHAVEDENLGQKPAKNKEGAIQSQYYLSTASGVSLNSEPLKTNMMLTNSTQSKVGEFSNTDNYQAEQDKTMTVLDESTEDKEGVVQTHRESSESEPTYFFSSSPKEREPITTLPASNSLTGEIIYGKFDETLDKVDNRKHQHIETEVTIFSESVKGKPIKTTVITRNSEIGSVTKTEYQTSTINLDPCSSEDNSSGQNATADFANIQLNKEDTKINSNNPTKEKNLVNSLPLLGSSINSQPNLFTNSLIETTKSYEGSTKIPIKGDIVDEQSYQDSLPGKVPSTSVINEKPLQGQLLQQALPISATAVAESDSQTVTTTRDLSSGAVVQTTYVKPTIEQRFQGTVNEFKNKRHSADDFDPFHGDLSSLADCDYPDTDDEEYHHIHMSSSGFESYRPYLENRFSSTSFENDKRHHGTKGNDKGNINDEGITDDYDAFINDFDKGNIPQYKSPRV